MSTGETVRLVIIYPGEDNSWIAECPSLPGCVSQGKTREEAVENMRAAMQFYIETLQHDKFLSRGML